MWAAGLLRRSSPRVLSTEFSNFDCGQSGTLQNAVVFQVVCIWSEMVSPICQPPCSGLKEKIHQGSGYGRACGRSVAEVPGEWRSSTEVKERHMDRKVFRQNFPYWEPQHWQYQELHSKNIPSIRRPVYAIGRHMATRQQKAVRVKRLSLAQRLIRNPLRLVDLSPRSRRLQRIGRRRQTLEVFSVVLLRL